jgi:hypothetical protein
LVDVPTNEDITKVKDDGADGWSHVCRAILSEEGKSGGIIARLCNTLGHKLKAFKVESPQFVTALGINPFGELT